MFIISRARSSTAPKGSTVAHQVMQVNHYFWKVFGPTLQKKQMFYSRNPRSFDDVFEIAA